MAKRISVFGGSSPKPGSKAYQQAYQLGKLLGEAGYTVLTGGYMGTMEAVSHGAAECGVHVIGVTTDEIENWRSEGPNPWVQEELRSKTFRDRLNTLVDDCDAAIALPGGIGTLLEICLTWNLMTINVLETKPLILVGEAWQDVMTTFIKALGDYVPLESREYIAYAPDPKSALDLLSYFSGSCAEQTE